jgi:hypothetical protein
MVRQGDFEVTMVHAETKQAFPEHIKDNQIYVEVEPEQEYFIGIQRVGNDVEGPMLARLFVDDKKLEHYHFFNDTSRRNIHDANNTISSGPPTYHGLWALKHKHDNSDGDSGNSKHDTWTDTALKFTKPRLIIQEEQPGKQQQQQQGQLRRRSRLLMGQIKVEFYQAIVVEKNNKVQRVSPNTKSPPPSSKRSWQASPIRITTSPTAGGPNNTSLVEKKGLRSGPGSITSVMHPQKRKRIQQRPPQQQQRSYKRGIQVYVFTLHYCSATGLMQVGVLSKPPVWVYHRKLLSASPQKRGHASLAASSHDLDVDGAASPISHDTTTTTTTGTSTTTTTTATSTTEHIVRTHELIDLVNDDDDDSDDDDSDVNHDSIANAKSPVVEMNV